MPDDPAARRQVREEPKHERLHRQLTELLEEMRMALPGVQVLFAFLPAVPFQQRFDTVGTFGRGAYLTALLFAAVALALLIGPSAYHRLQFRRHDVEHTIEMGHRMAVAGLICPALAIGAGVVVACSTAVSHQLARSCWVRDPRAAERPVVRSTARPSGAGSELIQDPVKNVPRVCRARVRALEWRRALDRS